MKRIFPIMSDEPEKGLWFAPFVYWIFAFLLVPFLMPVIGYGLWDDLQFSSGLEIAYHVLNGLVMVAMLKPYLADSFLNVQLEPKRFIKIVGLAALVMLALAAGLYYLLGDMIVNVYPINEMAVAITSGYLVEQQPIFGTVCYSLFTPFAVVGLFYASGFAPVCCRNRWLGYVVVTVLLALPCAFDIFWREQVYLVIPAFILQLPIHWIACWTYQKADTVWAPIATLAIFNLGTSLMALM